ncbi:MAG: protein kinase [Polyangiales bacterium]
MAPAPQPSPTRLGRYGVVRRLGVGGMAEVYLARSRGAEGVDKLLVVKRILPDFAENPHFRAMFVDEARVALRLNHPNIVQVYGFESDGPTLLLIMEHVDGADLGALSMALARQGEHLPPPLVAYVLREVARGLHYAHERLDEHGRPLEIVHRDVSPNNVLLSYEGAVKLGDFGIARVRSASDAPGVVQGKFGYMAPEQARGEAVDRRADLYGLGVLLTELLLGRPLFHGIAEGAEIHERVRRGDVPDPEALLQGAPDALRAIAVRAMKVDREERFPTARDVVHALSHYLHGLDTPADAGALEHFLHRALPPRHPSVPPPPNSSRPPPITVDSSAGAMPSATVPGRGRTPPTPLPAKNAITLPAMLMPSVPAPRVPVVDTAAVVRERGHVAVIAGRLSVPSSVPAARQIVHMVGELAFKAEATLEWSRDDGFMLVVGVLRPHVDDALRAARLALEILDAARSIAADADDDPGEVPVVSLGLARGVAGCARDGEGTMLSFELVDDAASLAGSLAVAARPGEALVSGALYRIVRRAFVLREAAPRGPSAVRAFALERSRSRTERDRSAEAQGWRLLGRETSLRELRNALVSASVTRQGRAVLVTGELGVGKTTVLGAFAAALSSMPGILGESRVLRCDGSITANGVRFGFAGQLVRQALALRHASTAKLPPPLPSQRDADGRPKGPPPLPRRRGSGEYPLPVDTMEQLLDAVAERYGQGPSGRRAARHVLQVCLGLAADEPGAEATTTRELGLVLRPLLADVARERPVLLLLDALEQADAPSRTVVSELLRRTPAGLVLMVAALRDDDPLTEELRGLQTIALGPLDQEARRRLIAGALGTDEPAEEVVREVSSVAGGNPLTILEVVEALAERERARARRVGTDPDGSGAPSPPDDDALPPSLEEVLTARLEALAPEARNLLRWCSLCEAELSVDLIDQLGGDGGARVRVRLVSDGILVHTGNDTNDEGRAVLAFAHPMLARVARASIEPTVIPAMHARVAELLERRRGPRAAPAALAALARHREAAGADRPAARSWLEAATQYVAAGASAEEAMRAYGRVLVLARGATDVEGYALRAAAHAGREDLARAAGGARVRRAELLALREVAVEARDPRLVAQALTRQARYKLETYASDADRDAVAAVRAARRADDRRTEAEARWVLAVHRGRKGLAREALAELDGALAALDAADGDAHGAGEEARAARALRAEVLLAKSALLRATGEVADAVAAAAKAYGLAAAHHHRRLVGPALEELGASCLAQGGYADAIRFLRASLAAEREAGGRGRVAGTLVRGAASWWALGYFDRALAWVQRARDALASNGRAGPSAAAADVYVALAELLVERGDVEGAAEAIDRARESVGAVESRHALYRVCLGDARVLMARRQHRHARGAAEAAERVARESGMVLEALHARAAAAEAAAALGDRVAARAWLDSVLGDPHFADPLRVYRGDQVVAGCARALRLLGDAASADLLDERLSAMRRRVAATAEAVTA